MGSLAAGQTGGEIQGRFNKDNWTNYDEANDWSYDPTKLAFADWDRVTLYRNGVLVWGTEPPGGGGGTNQTLTLNKAGTGTGTVTSSPAGLNCGAGCTTQNASFASGTNVTLTASAATGSAFAGWSGACTGTGTCTVAMTQARTVTATFNTAPTEPDADREQGGYGDGHRDVEPGRDQLRHHVPDAERELPERDERDPHAVGRHRLDLRRLERGLHGHGRLHGRHDTGTHGDGHVQAAPTNQTLTVNKAGTGTGTVTSSPAGINCGTACTTQNASFANGTNVTLTASAATRIDVRRLDRGLHGHRRLHGGDDAGTHGDRHVQRGAQQPDADVDQGGHGHGLGDVEPGRDQLRNHVPDAERQLRQRDQRDAHGVAPPPDPPSQAGAARARAPRAAPWP